MSGNTDLNLKDLIAFTGQELLEKVWPACNAATLLIVAGRLRLMITDLRTGERCTLAELRNRYTVITISDQTGAGEFSFNREAAVTQSDIEAFEAEYPEVAEILRDQGPIEPEKAVGKSGKGAGPSTETTESSLGKHSVTKRESSKGRFPPYVIKQCREVARKLKPLENDFTYREVRDHAEMVPLFGGKEPPKLDTFKKWMKRNPPIPFNTDPGKRSRKPEDLSAES